ncbi:MAG: enoyl-ACP reductase FabI [Novosphingobium aromaticivorans]|jgi:enoyl-[acyl-carrier protein] reductase I|nr:enoyl-ACP reductase FabI [Novosphingobium aromaticivorans]
MNAPIPMMVPTAPVQDGLPALWDPQMPIGAMLAGKRGLVVGVANDHSIAYGCAARLRALGADLALTYLNAKAEPHVRPLAERLGADLCLPLDVEEPGALERVFETIAARWGSLDFVIHSIAFAPREDLHGRVMDCSAQGFAQAMHVSVYSFLAMARLAEPLLNPGASLITMTYYGADKVVGHYNVMGPVKAALEASTRYLAAELGEKGVRVHAVSPGPLRTRAASGIADFDSLTTMAQTRSPAHRLVDIAEIGNLVAFLVGAGASGMTGDTIYVDAGLHNMA